jgi:hypothetical protein
MARPAKKSCDYFPHDAGMRNHKKIKAIRTKFGVTGYAVWCMLLEHLTGSDYTRFEYSDLEFELLSGDFGVSATEIREVVDYCFVLGLLFKTDNWISSESLNERLEPVFAKRERAKEFLQQQPRSNGRFCNSNTDATGVSVTEMPQRKGKEIKENEKKGDESKLGVMPSADVSQIPESDNLQPEPNAPEKPDTQKKFRPPEISEVENYMFKIDFPGIIKNEAEKFINHYTANGWMVGKSKMKNWQATVRNWKLRRNEESTITTTGTGVTGNTGRTSKHGHSDEELYAAVARQHGIQFVPPNGNGGN